jgi:hypothetical protein
MLKAELGTNAAMQSLQRLVFAYFMTIRAEFAEPIRRLGAHR